MIEHCPRCDQDVLFSRDICPACGQTVSPAERAGPTDLERRQQASRVPVYTVALEEVMTQSERRGRIELGLVSGALLGPVAVYALVRLCRLQPDWRAFILLAALYALVRQLWTGRPWARRLAGAVALAVGLAVPVRTYALREALPPALQLLLWGVGLVTLAAAWPLWRSVDLTDFLRRRRRLPP